MNTINKKTNLFQEIVENSADGILVIDPQGVIRFSNPAARILLDKNSGMELDGQMFGFPMVSGESTDIEIISRQGEIRSIEMRVAETSWNNEPVYIASLRDISSRKKVENELRKSRKEWKSTFDAIDEAILLFDLDGRIIRYNRSCTNVFSLDEDEITGKFYYELMGHNDPMQGCPIADTLRNQSKSEFQINQWGTQRIIDIKTFPIFDEEDILLGAVLVAKDISSQRKLESKLRQAQKMESIGTLAGGIAHDFNNILSVILGFTGLAKEKAKGLPSLQDDLQEVYSASLRATDLVRQILSFSRRGDSEIAPMHVSPVLKEALKLLRSTLPTNIDMQIDISEGLKPILADATQFHQIIMNLCTNASHAMEPGGGILKIGLHPAEISEGSSQQYSNLSPGYYLKLTVIDTGCGISPENLQFIFDPYYTTKKLGEGTGLGLSIVHGIVKEYGGEIFIDSIPGEGTSIGIYFPTIEGVRAPSSAGESRSLEHRSGHGTILVVDDEKALTSLLGRILADNGYKVAIFNDSVEALAYFQDHADGIDLVITDMTMPKMTGDQIAAKISNIKKNTPLILLTGYSKAISRKDTKLPGVAEVIMKPFVKDDLLQTVHNLLAKKEKR